MCRPLIAGVLAALIATPLAADPAVIYSTGGKFDKSFNEAAFNGAERFAADTGQAYRDYEIKAESESEQALRRFARAGAEPIVAIGFNHAAAVAKVAAEFPDLKFSIVDMVVDAPNVRSVVFREHEGSYVVGVLAAMASETGTVGFVGGMDIPLIRKFACGYIQGVRRADPDAAVIVNMTGDTPAAWGDPTRGGEIARAQIEAGADVIIQAAGGTGIGVLQAAADAGVLGIGTDSNQNGLHPGSVLTSMRKRTDTAVYENFMDVMEGEWTPGIVALGLAEGGLDWVIDADNEALITDAMKAAADAAAADVIAGRVTVHDASMDGPCPVQ